MYIVPNHTFSPQKKKKRQDEKIDEHKDQTADKNKEHEDQTADKNKEQTDSVRIIIHIAFN